MNLDYTKIARDLEATLPRMFGSAFYGVKVSIRQVDTAHINGKYITCNGKGFIEVGLKFDGFMLKFLYVVHVSENICPLTAILNKIHLDVKKGFPGWFGW